MKLNTGLLINKTDPYDRIKVILESKDTVVIRKALADDSFSPEQIITKSYLAQYIPFYELAKEPNSATEIFKKEDKLVQENKVFFDTHDIVTIKEITDSFWVYTNNQDKEFVENKETMKNFKKVNTLQNLFVNLELTKSKIQKYNEQKEALKAPIEEFKQTYKSLMEIQNENIKNRLYQVLTKTSIDSISGFYLLNNIPCSLTNKDIEILKLNGIQLHMTSELITEIFGFGQDKPYHRKHYTVKYFNFYDFDLNEDFS